MREFMCWYWKVNQIVDLLKEINNNLKVNGTSISANKPEIIKKRTNHSLIEGV